MKLSEYLLSGTIIQKKAMLLKTIKLDNGERRKKGNIVTIVKKNLDGKYHAEDNDWSCWVDATEFKYI